MVDTNGNDLTTKATYNFADLSLGFVASDLQSILSGMDSTTAPATNELTLTFEVTTDSDTPTNKTATVENVKVQIVKTQKFDEAGAKKILDEVTKISKYTGAGNDTLFDYNETEGSSISDKTTKIKNTADGGASGNPSIATAAEGFNQSNRWRGEYSKYFDSFKLGTTTGKGTKNALIQFIFTPKNIYDFPADSLTRYMELILADTDSYNWNE